MNFSRVVVDNVTFSNPSGFKLSTVEEHKYMLRNSAIMDAFAGS